MIGSKGAKNIFYSDPLLEIRGSVPIKELTPLNIFDLSLKELIITDEHMNFAFMNVYDSFTTVLMSKDQNINNIVQEMDFEGFVCDSKTYMNWYLREK